MRIILCKIPVVIISVGVIVAGCQPSSFQPEEFSVNVTGFKAQEQPVQEKINLVATLEANEQVDIKSEVDGAVNEIFFEEGKTVEKGDILFHIDPNKLKAALEQARANLQLAEATAARYEGLVKTLAVSKQEYDQTVADLEFAKASVALAEAQFKDATIRAPFDGTMGERLISRGQFIARGTNLGYLIDDDPVKASFYVPERFLGEVRVGQQVEMSVAAYPKEIFTGEVYFIDPRVSQQTRSALIKARVPNPDGRLRPGMFAHLNLVIRLKADAVVIPEAALMINLDKMTVFTVDGDQRVKTREVKPGVRFDGLVEIEEGLQAGEIVVTEGTQKVRDGVKVNVKF